jgi:hypothetical protein
MRSALLFSLSIVSGCVVLMHPLDRIHYGMTKSDIENVLGKPDKTQQVIISDQSVLQSIVDESDPHTGLLRNVRIGDKVSTFEYTRGRKTLVVRFINEDPKPADIYTWERTQN